MSWVNENNYNLGIKVEEPVRSRYNSLNHYKNDYIRKFDEMNKGLADSYTLTKGGALLQINKHKSQSIMDLNHQPSQSSYIQHRTPNYPQLQQNLNESYQYSANLNPSYSYNYNSDQFKAREHDFRSVWIPKKFEGRNMFASHIDSMIFPDKAG
jgi:hypothetical protein